MEAEEDKRRNREGIRLLWNYILEGVRRCCGLHFQRGVINEARKGGERGLYKFSGQVFLTPKRRGMWKMDALILSECFWALAREKVV